MGSCSNPQAPKDRFPVLALSAVTESSLAQKILELNPTSTPEIQFNDFLFNYWKSNPTYFFRKSRSYSCRILRFTKLIYVGS